MTAAPPVGPSNPKAHSSAFGRTCYAPNSDLSHGLPTGRAPTISIEDDASDSDREADNAEQRALRLSAYPKVDEIPYPRGVVVPVSDQHRNGYQPGTMPPDAHLRHAPPSDDAHQPHSHHHQQQQPTGRQTTTTKATLADLGVHFRSAKSTEMTSWHQAAELRAVPLDVDREQHLLHSNLHSVELARRLQSQAAARKRSAVLDQRARPWRENDAMSDDRRWTHPGHEREVRQLNRNLDDTLKTWRQKQVEKRVEEVQARPGRNEQHQQQQPQAGHLQPDAGQVDPAPCPPAPDRSSSDLLARLVDVLETQLGELRVYDQIFHSITRPTAARPDEPQASVVCPSAPLCDLLDRIRCAHAAFYPQCADLFTEVRRRLQFDWLLEEMARRKEVRLSQTKEDLDQWSADLSVEHQRSERHSAELHRTKATLRSHADQAFFEAPPSRPTMVYDANQRRLVHMQTEEEVERLQAQPTQWYGEQSASDDDYGEDVPAPLRTRKRTPLERQNSAGEVAWRRERAQRRLAKVQVRLQQRAKQRQAEGEWRAQRAAAKASPAGMQPEAQTELFHLLGQQEQARRRAVNSEEEKIDVSESESPAESTSGEGSGDDPHASAEAKSSRLALLPADQRKRKLLARVSRHVVRAFTSRPLLHIRPLTSGDKVGGRVFLNSDYFVFELGEADPGVWIRLFATEAGTAENHIELQLAYAAPPTKARRFFTTSTQDAATHASIDLRSFEMRRAREEHEAKVDRAMVLAGSDARQSKAADARASSTTTTTAAKKKSPARWYLRVVGRGFSMKAYALEFRIHTSVLDYSRLLGDALQDLETQSAWQATLNDKALVLDQLALEIMPPTPTKSFAQARRDEMETNTTRGDRPTRTHQQQQVEEASVYEEIQLREEDDAE